MESFSDKDRTAISKHFDYRVPVYVADQYSQRPSKYLKEVRINWVLGISFNILTLVFVVLAVSNVMYENAKSEVKLIRIDGVIIKEGDDIRRDVLIKNAIQRASLRNIKAITNVEK